MNTRFIFIVLLLFLFSVAHAYDRGHTYIRGVVSDMGEQEEILSGEDEPLKTQSFKSITISGSTYSIDPQCRVAVQYEDKGAYHERVTRLSELRRGDSVFVKVIGTRAYEILIEGWKR